VTGIYKETLSVLFSGMFPLSGLMPKAILKYIQFHRPYGAELNKIKGRPKGLWTGDKRQETAETRSVEIVFWRTFVLGTYVKIFRSIV
jgi:hypothetical protein